MPDPLLSPSIDFVYTPVINFAMQQNHVPVVRQLLLKNTAGQDLENVTVEITSEPDFAVAWNHKIELLVKDESIEVTPVNLRISSKYLAGLTERVAGTFTLKISSNERVIAEQVYDVSILAFDQWNGITILPEMVAAFVTPNHPQIVNVIKRASIILEKWTGSPSFDSYQTQNPDRVRKQMAAIYEAIAELEITYVTVPASFEAAGQRVRLCDAIFSHKIGNCLDLSLLYAACLEAVGINALIVIIKGHAFAGAWLIDDSFADSANDDVSLITKRTAEGIYEIAVVETTCMNAGQKASFDDAVRAANQHLVKVENFLLFVDVKRARFSGVRPLPLRMPTLHGWEIVEPASVTRDADAPEELVSGPKLVDVDKLKVSKQSIWERKLLDLSLRNNLLNLRITKTTIQLISVNLNKLEDALASGIEFQVLSKPADWDNPLRSSGLYQSLNQSDPISDLMKNEFLQKRLRAYLPENELTTSITNLYRSARLSLEENGANTLYIALGLLKWYETNISERPRYAPILLMPVDIIKKSAQKGFVIRSREEDTMMNITMLEMMRQDFGINLGGFETLPKDENGVDVRAVFSIIRQGIMSQSRWDVEEQAFLGTFSFSKFIMWNDIHNNADKLSKNKVVASLMSGKMEWDAGVEEPITHLDKQYHPSDIALPISTDSSQLEAIAASVNNKSFILHGPPGTGKSQTITNIIANALYNGKKVLFVAEKMAALNVVEKRLKAIGLAPFCLELHSNKTKKSSVLEQLKKTSEVTKTTPPETFAFEAERLQALRSELNGYVDALHHVYGFGFSLYDAFTGHAQFANAKGNISFQHDIIDTLTKQQLTQWNDLAEELQTAAAIIGQPHNHALKEMYISNYTPSIKSEAREVIPKYIKALVELKSASVEVIRLLKVNEPPTSTDKLNVLKLIATLLLQLPDTSSSMIAAENMEQTLSQVIDVTVHGKRRDTLRDGLTKGYHKAILSLEAQRYLAEWNAASTKWFLPKWLKQNSIKKAVNKLSLSGRVDNDHVIPLFENIINYQEEQSHLDLQETFLAPLLGFLWKAGNCDWTNLVTISTTLLQINRQAIMLLGNAVESRRWRIEFSHECAEGTKSLLEYNSLVLNKYIDAHGFVLKIENDLSKLLGVDLASIKGSDTNKVETAKVTAERWLANIEGIKDWSNWNTIKQKAIDTGLSPMVSALEEGYIQSNDVVNNYKKGLYRSCAEYIFTKNQQLASFNGKQFQEKIRRFREISAAFEKLTKEELYAKLASKIPNFTQEASQSSEVGILQRAIRTNGRGNSIRKLFDSIPNLLPRMNPCMLMSPISVAQYFDAGTAKFDLVVFDEASQMPTCDAVGAIARASNVVIVGDPKQMPPTNFFSSNYIDEENFDKEDLESILDDCLALSMPSKHLLWHYRSKHESLIAFSNSKYYENKLLTFPSPDDISSKVKFIPVEGYYDRGKSKHNKAEAKAIVDEIVFRLTDPVLSTRSIGVVTFSSIQQILIDDMLNEVLKTRPDLEALVMQAAEPIFIKNLENVQGDERDVILFSVGYGPDKEGKVSLNFGPINRNGGWRRLNVAVSRARYEMKVFSTLKADQIDVTRTASEGVAGLKSFLEYAEKGKEVLHYRNVNKHLNTPALVETIAEEIRKGGYEVHTNIGCSGYRMDLAIVDTENTKEYILGILCDGHNYSAAKTARDREIVQVDVLKLLGWNIHKIWSTEWWENADRQMQGVIAAIKEAEERKKMVPVQLKEPEPFKPVVSLKEEDLVFNKAVVLTTNEFVKQPHNDKLKSYTVTRLAYVSSASSDEFLLPINQQKICDQIVEVIETEAPISRNLLCKRVLAAWGISRLGTRLSTHFNILLPTLNFQTTGDRSNLFFWRPGQIPGEYTDYRVPKTDAEKRDAEDICPEEVANAIKQVTKEQISISKDELIRETAKIFGFARIGTNVEQAMVRGIAHAISKSYVSEGNGRLVFND
jgi:hypothetical protein